MRKFYTGYESHWPDDEGIHIESWDRRFESRHGSIAIRPVENAIQKHVYISVRINFQWSRTNIMKSLFVFGAMLEYMSNVENILRLNSFYLSIINTSLPFLPWFLSAKGWCGCCRLQNGVPSQLIMWPRKEFETV